VCVCLISLILHTAVTTASAGYPAMGTYHTTKEKKPQHRGLCVLDARHTKVEIRDEILEKKLL